MSAFWTIAAEETLFASEAAPASYREITCSGISLIVEDIAEDQCKVVRVLSTNPADYLIHSLQPGAILRKEAH